MPAVIPGSPTSGQLSLSKAVRHGRLFYAYTTTTLLFVFRDNANFVQLIDRPFGDTQIERVTFDRRLGGLAISAGDRVQIYDEVYTYSPESENGFDIRWALARQTTVKGSKIRSLSWGLDGELLVGNDYLSLYHPSSTRPDELIRSWHFVQSQPVSVAQFSPDASLIASFGTHDRLVKIWRRLSDRVTSSGTKTSDFDFDYLVHPRAVADVKWRQPFHEDLVVDNIIYSTASDDVLRIWASDVPHDSHILTLHESIPANDRVNVVLDDDVFTWALAKAKSDEKDAKALKLLSEVSDNSPEVALSFGRDGTMRAYVLHNLGSRSHKRSSQKIFFERPGLNILAGLKGDIWCAVDIQRHGTYDLLFFVGDQTQIVMYEVKLVDLFSDGKLRRITSLCGHSEIVTSMTRKGNALLTSSKSAELWWSSVDHQLISTSEAQEYTNGHAETPEHVKLHDPLAVSTMDEYTAVITREGSLQIWSNAFDTSFTGSPEYVWGSELIALSWLGGSSLAVCSSTTISVLQCTIELWSCSYSCDVSQFTSCPLSSLGSVDDLLVAAAGSVLYSFDESDWGAIDLNAQLPVYHPSFLRYLLLLGNTAGARHILSALHDQLVDSSAPLSPDLGLTKSLIFKSEVATAKNDYSAIFGSPSESNSILPASKADSLRSLLSQLNIPQLASHQSQLISIAAALVRVEKEEQSLDPMGLRFYLSYCIIQDSEDDLSFADIMWARLSSKQDILVNLVKSKVKTFTWEYVRKTKIFYWLKDDNTVREIAETIAKAEFLSGEDRDPVAASLWYFALNKKSVLLSLWRMSGSHPEHASTTKILANDFDVPKWRTAANKNAFALIGRRRYQYAAAWFLLGSSVKDAVSVCVRNVEDVDLALAVARIAGDQQALKDLIDTIHSKALVAGDKVFACWCDDMRSKMSLDTIMSPLSSTTADSPALLILYEQLRKQYGAHERERDFIEYISRMFDRRGCIMIGDQVKSTWTYQEPRKIEQIVTLETYKETNKTKLAEAPKAVFEEPTMDSFAAFDF